MCPTGPINTQTCQCSSAGMVTKKGNTVMKLYDEKDRECLEATCNMKTGKWDKPLVCP